jgi:hypothetical protein
MSHAKRLVLLVAACCTSTTTMMAVHGFAPVSFPSTTSSSISAAPAAAAMSKRRRRRRRITTTTFRLTAARSNNPAAGELTNTLARLDGLWRRQQSTFSRWHYLSVGNREDEIAYLLAPPAHHSAPSCIIVFTGGAGTSLYHRWYCRPDIYPAPMGDWLTHPCSLLALSPADQVSARTRK